MKRKLIASILGVAASSAMVASSYGQGEVSFANYAFEPGGLVSAPVTFAAGSPGGIGGETVGSEFTATLLYEYGTMTSYSVAPNSATPFFSTDGNTAGGAGTFANTVTLPVLIPGYTGGSISFEVLATGAVNGHNYTGTSAPDVLPSIVTLTSGTPYGDMFNSGAAGTYLQPFTVSTPEPSTIALAGLGVASLLALRRRK
jgi:hypothetical protein